MKPSDGTTCYGTMSAFIKTHKFFWKCLVTNKISTHNLSQTSNLNHCNGVFGFFIAKISVSIWRLQTCNKCSIFWSILTIRTTRESLTAILKFPSIRSIHKSTWFIERDMGSDHSVFVIFLRKRINEQTLSFNYIKFLIQTS